jgi:alanine dehydrogenase
MQLPKSVGFPRMQNEPAERRVFLPEFIQFLANLNVAVYLEDGYGSRSGLTFDNYAGGIAGCICVPASKPFSKMW